MSDAHKNSAGLLDFPAVCVQDAFKATLLDVPSFKLPIGACLAITGPSGAGKSLYLHALFGMLAGQEGDPILDSNRGDRLIVQDPSSGLTPGKTLASHLKDVTHEPADKQRFLALMNELQLDPAMLGKKPNECSGGERQRIMFALAWFNSPVVLACDEPASSLDYEREQALMQLITEFKRPTLKATLFISHRIRLIDEFASHVLLIENGKVTYFGDNGSFRKQANTDFHRDLIHQRQTSVKAPKIDSKGPNRLRAELVLPHGQRDKVQIRLDRQDWLWVLGPSGCGKTTLMNAVVGLHPAISGEIFLDDQAIELNFEARNIQQRQAIHLVWQHAAQTWNPALAVKVQIERSIMNPERLPSIMDDIGLSDIDLNRLPDAYSMGELQRLSLVVALLSEPRVLLLDEFFAPLQENLRQRVVTHLHKWMREQNFSVIVSTHDEWLTQCFPAQVLTLSSVDNHV